MTRTLLRVGAVALSAWLAAPGWAQEATDWSVFQELDPVECYGCLLACEAGEHPGWPGIID